MLRRSAACRKAENEVAPSRKVDDRNADIGRIASAAALDRAAGLISREGREEAKGREGHSLRSSLWPNAPPWRNVSG